MVHYGWYMLISWLIPTITQPLTQPAALLSSLELHHHHGLGARGGMALVESCNQLWLAHGSTWFCTKWFRLCTKFEVLRSVLEMLRYAKQFWSSFINVPALTEGFQWRVVTIKPYNYQKAPKKRWLCKGHKVGRVEAVYHNFNWFVTICNDLM